MSNESNKSNPAFKIILFIIVVIGGVVFNYIKDKPKVTLEEATLAQYNLYMKAEKSDNLPLDETEIKEVLEYSKETVEEQVLYLMSNFELKEIPESDLDSMHKKMIEISKKITPKITITSEEKDMATIEISSKIIDSSAYDDFFEKELEKYSDEELTESKTALALYNSLLDEAIKNPKYESKEKTVKLTLTRVDKEWLMNDESDLDKLIELMPII